MPLMTCTYITANPYQVTVRYTVAMVTSLYSVVIIVDTSTPVASHIIRLQEDLKLLIQQQLPLVDSFNMVRCVSDYSLTVDTAVCCSFSSDCEVWRSELVEPSPDILAEAWM